MNPETRPILQLWHLDYSPLRSLTASLAVVQNDTIMWKEALCKRKQGKCPLEPGEVALVLKGMGYTEASQIYVASGPVYGGNARMRPLQRLFPNLVPGLSTRKERTG